MRHYVIVRRDLPLGVLAAQVVHAAGESSDRVPSGTHAVVLAVPDEHALARTASKLAEAEIPHVLIAEPDAPWSGALMAIGLEPTTHNLRSVLGRLPLLGEK